MRLEHGQSESSSTPTRGTLPSPFSPPGPHLLSVGWKSVQIFLAECERPGEQARGKLRSVTEVSATQAGLQVIRAQRSWFFRAETGREERDLVQAERQDREAGSRSSRGPKGQKDREHLDLTGH